MRRAVLHCGLVPAAVWAAAFTVAAQGVELPANDGWVTDLAGFLTPEEERSLETQMESYRQGSGNEIALLTVAELGGQTIERYALEVGRSWGMGQRDRHNAALLVVARDERKVRIEVARGLEGNLTDSISGRIIRNVIAPPFKQGRYYDGLRAGVAAMQAAAGGDYAAIPESRGSRGSGIAGLIGPILVILIVLAILRGGRRGGGLGGALPWLIAGSALGGRSHSRGWHSGGGGGFGGFGGGGGFSGGGASGGW
ncbi:MAG TPA: TPM domain-containing protein [Candidatus Polarisedimenticolaceae bacterium]|nr:TPM domain-containing protein [Candidatus Polarisedimenticolaceae bacterium]